MDVLDFPIRSDKLRLQVKVDRVLYSGRSQFQQIDIFETTALGNILLLDGHIQLATLDEAAYHESLVQIPLMALDKPKCALVVGGGDGAVVRELCRSSKLQRIDLVEIDGMVIEACRRYLPSLPGGAFDDPRVNLHLTDAFQFVKEVDVKYDLIVMDCTDVYEDEEGELSEQLFTREFYEDVRRALSPDGLVVSQADNLVFCPEAVHDLTAMFAELFPRTGWYQAVVPSFGGFSGFVWAGNGRVPYSKWSEIPEKSEGLVYLNESTYNWAFSPLVFSR